MTQRRDLSARFGVAQHIVRCANGRYTELHLTRKLAMAVFCTECQGFEDDPVNCTSRTCPLYPFRSGTQLTLRGTIHHIPPAEGSEPRNTDRSGSR